MAAIATIMPMTIKPKAPVTKVLSGLGTATEMISTVGADGGVDGGAAIDVGGAIFWALETYASAVVARVGVFAAKANGCT